MFRKKSADPQYTDEELRALWAMVDKETPCIHCGGLHPWPFTACRRVKRTLYYPPNQDGVSPVHEIEYCDEWDQSSTIYVHELPERPTDAT